MADSHRNAPAPHPAGEHHHHTHHPPGALSGPHPPRGEQHGAPADANPMHLPSTIEGRRTNEPVNTEVEGPSEARRALPRIVEGLDAATKARLEAHAELGHSAEHLTAMADALRAGRSWDEAHVTAMAKAGV